MKTSDSKPKRLPLIVHFLANDRQRLRAAAESADRSMSNLAAGLIRDGLDKIEQQRQQTAGGQDAR